MHGARRGRLGGRRRRPRSRYCFTAPLLRLYGVGPALRPRQPNCQKTPATRCPRTVKKAYIVRDSVNDLPWLNHLPVTRPFRSLRLECAPLRLLGERPKHITCIWCITAFLPLPALRARLGLRSLRFGHIGLLFRVVIIGNRPVPRSLRRRRWIVVNAGFSPPISTCRRTGAKGIKSHQNGGAEHSTANGLVFWR